jgi:hypothetical protein
MARPSWDERSSLVAPEGVRSDRGARSRRRLGETRSGDCLQRAGPLSQEGACCSSARAGAKRSTKAPRAAMGHVMRANSRVKTERALMISPGFCLRDDRDRRKSTPDRGVWPAPGARSRIQRTSHQRGWPCRRPIPDLGRAAWRSKDRFGAATPVVGRRSAIGAGERIVGIGYRGGRAGPCRPGSARTAAARA